MLTLPEVAAEVRRRAALIGAPDRTLPTFGPSDDCGQPNVEVDGRGYHYVVAERGHENERVTTPDLEELLFHVFDSVTFSMGCDFASANRVPGRDYRRALFDRQVELLGSLSPPWAERASLAHSRILVDHPFNDAAAHPRGYSIRPAPQDLLIYAEDEGRTIAFGCPTALEPPQVSVPAAGCWARDVPEWARDRRPEIIDRLRAAGCVVFEVAPSLTVVCSTDGTLRIESRSEPDERGYQLISTRIVGLPSEEALLTVEDHTAAGPIRFMGSCCLDLTLQSRSGASIPIRIDLPARTFRLPATGASRPMDELRVALANAGGIAPSVPAAIRRGTEGPRASTLFQRAGAAAISAVLTIGGAGLALTGRSVEDRLAGAAGVVFFGLITARWIWGLKQWGAALPGRPAAAGVAAPRPGWTRALPYLPLAALLGEVPWCVAVFLGFLFIVGDKPFTSTPAGGRFAQVVIALPAVAGFLAGVVVMAFGFARGRLQWVCLTLGWAGCALCLVGATWGLVR